MEGMAVALLHIPLEEFYAMDYEVFSEALYQYHAGKQADARLSWEQTRFMTGQLMRPNLKNPSINLKELIPLPWDGEESRIEHALDVQACQAALSFIPAFNKH